MCTSARSDVLRRAACALALVLGGCAAGPDFVRPAAPATTQYVPGTPPAETAAGDGARQRFSAETALTAEWWTRFGSAPLDATVAEALAGNRTLASARATLEQSEDALRAGYGLYMPHVGVDLAASRQRASPLRFGQSGPASIFNLFTLSGTVGYVVDLFGGARREVESLRASADVERNTLRAAYLALTANVVETSIARAGYQAEIAATRTSIGAAAERLKLAQTQYQAGTTAYASVMSLKSELASLEATLPPLQLRADQAGHLLAVLVGKVPADWQPPELALSELTLPEELPLSLPSSLVRQRPDILIAEARLHVASAEVGIATANLLPTLTLSGSLGRDAAVWSDLRNSNGRIWSGGADLSVPVFEGGQAWYGRKAAVDAYRAARADYQQVVLTAFEQVADTLRALEHDAELVRDNGEARAAARDALALTDANYRAGIADYLALMTATQAAQGAEVAYLGAIAQRLQDTVALYVALGGGWWNADPAAQAAR